MTAFLLTAWRWIAGSRVAQGVMFVAGLIAYHLIAKSKAARDAVKGEQAKAKQKAQSRRAEVHNHVESERTKQRQKSQDRNRKETGRDGMDSDW